MTERTLRVLLGVDIGNELDPTLLRRAAEFTRRLEAQLHVVQVLETSVMMPGTGFPGSVMGEGLPPAIDPDVRERALQDLQRTLRSSVALQDLTWVADVQDGPAAVRLLAVADELDAYLIIVGAPSTGFRALVDHMAGGSVARELERRSTRPLLLVPRATKP